MSFFESAFVVRFWCSRLVVAALEHAVADD